MVGHGGTRPVVLFPKPITDKLEQLGFRKSKKGAIYKNYNDGTVEIQAFPSCIGDGERKGVKWFVRTLEEPKGRTVILSEALEMSMQFNADAEVIHDMISELNSR